MKRKPIHDPLAVLAANTTLGQDADRQFLPFLVHLEEIRQGHGTQDNYDVCSVYLQAMLSTVASARHQQLRAMIIDACNAWLEADAKRMKLATDRMLLTGDQMKAISKAVRFFMMVMPQVKLGIWVAAVAHGRRVLERSIVEYNTRYGV